MSTSSAHIRGGSRIAVLPAAVADQIAAGEVVERPASAVKELVENALDAGATTIEVALEEGGRTLIRVSDDGCGMDRDELLLALERHATSKIRSAADLVGVASFGFRGEALPAVASVSRLEIASATEGGEGTIVRVAGGSVTEVAATTRRTGTTVSVGQLFYNVPARLKFLRSARSEWRAATESLIATALCRRDLRLGVTHDGKSALTLPPASSMRARVAGIWGGTFAERFIEADDVTGPVHVSGLVERPADVGTASRRVFVAVNGRPVRDAGMVRAAERAYRSTIVPGVRPSLFLEIVLPMVTPGIAATAILCFLYAWNDFFFALILTRTNARTAPVAVVNFMNYEGWEWGKIAAGGSLVMAPVLIFSLAVRRYLVSGLTAGAVKG